MVEATAIRRHWWAAFLLSLFLAAGTGQIYNGRPRKIIYIICALVLLLAAFHTAIPSTFTGFAAVFAGLWIVPLVAAIEAGVSARRQPMVARQPYHRWYIYLAYAAAFQLGLFAINAGVLATFGEPSLFGAYKPFSVSSGSSEPNLRQGDYFFAATAQGTTERELSHHVGSYVLVSWPDVGGSYVYRLLAVGGQSIAMRDGVISIDGKTLPRRAICSVNDATRGQVAQRSIETIAAKSYVVQNFDGNDYTRNSEEVAVPDGQFFVVGDSRDNSNDSRFRGPVANEDFAGRALFIIWSKDWRRIGKSLAPGEAVETADYCPADAK